VVNSVKCKVCLSSCTHEVNDMLSRRVAYRLIKAFLKERAYEISEMAISRHKRNCLEKGAKAVVRRVATRSKARTKKAATDDAEQTRDARRQELVIRSTMPDNAPASSRPDRQRRFVRYLKKMKEDVDVFSESIWLLALSKDRVERAIEEEIDTGLVISTTGQAIKEYGWLLRQFHEMSQGLDSLAKLRYVQMIQLLNTIIGSAKLSDRTRFEIMGLLQDPEAKGEIEAQVAAFEAAVTASE